MPPNWLVIISWIALILAFACALIVLWDIFVNNHRQKMRIMESVWPITALYMGVFGLWAYWAMGRQSMDSGQMQHSHSSGKKPFWQSVFVSVCHCGGGCTLGDIIGEWGVFLIGFNILGSILWTDYLIDYILALLIGIAFQYFAIVPMRHYSPSKGLIEASKADFLSLTAFEVGMFGWMALTHFVFFHPSIHPDSPVFWFMMQLGMSIGFLTSYPMNWFLVSKGIKEAM